MAYENLQILIPAYKPDDKLNALIDDLHAAGFGHIVVVDDGGGEPFAPFFAKAREQGAVVLTHEEDPEYVGAPWPSGAVGDEVSVIHLLAIHPSMRGRGLGREVVTWCIETARGWGKRAIHLDVVPGNLAAARIYTACGFDLVFHHMVHYEDLGDTNLEMYELVL